MNKPKITHVMSDGSVRTDISGLVIPASTDTMAAYSILVNITKREEQTNERIAS